MKIQELMTRDPACCTQDDTLNRSAQLMWEHDCGAIPVVSDEGRVIGIVTDRDTCMAAYTRGKRLSEIPVGEAMSPDLISCHEDDSVTSVQTLMRDHRVRRLPVLDDAGCLSGMISLNDLARAAYGPRKGVRKDGISRTLAAISEHRELRPGAARAAE
jgi:CBS domain-containing protein